MMTSAFGGNLTGLTSDHPQVQEALSRVWRAPRALRLSDGTFAAFDHRGALLAVGLTADALAEQIELYVALEEPKPNRLPLRNGVAVRRFSERGEPEIDLAELGL
jgi:hypothetical protein